MEKFSNPFNIDSTDMVTLDTKEIAGRDAVEAVQKMKRIGQVQFQSFTREHLLDRVKPINDLVNWNKLKVYKTPTTRSVSKQKQQLTNLKNNAELFFSTWGY